MVCLSIFFYRWSQISNKKFKLTILLIENMKGRSVTRVNSGHDDGDTCCVGETRKSISINEGISL